MKRVWILLLVFVLSGCSVNYNLTVDNHKKIREEVILLEDNKNILKFSSSVDKFLDTNVNNFSDYNVKKIIGNEESGYKLVKKYSDFNSFKKSKFFQKSFEDLDVSGKNSLSFNTIGEYYRNNIFTVPLESTFKYVVDDVVVNIKFYNEVISSNADKFDSKKNVYTWFIDKDESFENINFELSNKVRYDVMIGDLFNKYKFVIIVLLIVIFGVIVFIGKLKNIIAHNNKI